MDITPLSRAIEVDWLAASPIGPSVIAFTEHLTELRYAASTIADYLADIKHFARWVHTRRLQLARIDEVSVAIFLDDHLPSCACIGHMRRTQ